MTASKIVDEGEVLRWFEEGRTYAWMVEEYRRKYNIETVPSMWGNFRRRRGLDRRLERNDDLIPWAVRKEHRWAYPVMMLRQEARRRAGYELTPEREEQLEAWLAGLSEQDAVIHYDPDTEQGWWRVKRRPGVDTDLIRVPERKTTERHRTDE